MEKIQVFVSVATSIVTFVTLIYNIGIKQGKSREKRYYEKVLRPFMVQWSENHEIDALLTIGNLVKREDDDVPRYVFHLVNKKKEKKLKTVLIYDYLCFYPNDVTSINKILDSISKICYYALFITALIFFFLGIVYWEEALSGLILIGYNFIIKKEQIMDSGNVDLNMCVYLLSIGGFLILGCIVIMKLANWVNTDRYSLNKKVINSMIKRKCKRYEKNKKKYSH